MNDFRKTILASITISFLVGSVAGVTGGIVASQVAAGNIGQRLLASLPPSLQWIVPRAAPPPQSSPIKGEEAKGNSPPLVGGVRGGGQESDSTVEVVRRVSPAVVSIVISKEVAQRSVTSPFPEDLFRQFGFEIEIPQEPAPQQPPGPPKKQQVGGGSGFVVSKDGLIVTNKHVVFDEAATYTVVTSEGKRYDAKVMARDPFIDLALIKIEAQGLPTVKFGNSDNLQIGESVIAIGNALSEFSNTITRGVVSGIKRRVTAGGPGIGSEVIEEAIQTDAAINPGNSGGPLVNMKGEVIGINTAVSQAGQNLGFAIPVNQAKPVIESVIKIGRIVRPWLGVRYVIITPELKQENQLPVDYGALIVRGAERTNLAIAPASPADKAGLRENDIILEIDRVKITEDRPLAGQIQKHQPGDTVTLKILSQGKEREVKVELEELKQ
ncbi:trypsin-like peptidase domain-containing protein [Candidatus Uhrbacteria bacterium]|nr:trypsin-like peptidase domain-containing protein [Candidatus Uhrbacteria bacterium]